MDAETLSRLDAKTLEARPVKKPDRIERASREASVNAARIHFFGQACG
jgi:hypothetical protein